MTIQVEALSTMKAVELRAICKEARLSQKGSKEVLVTRIMDNMAVLAADKVEKVEPTKPVETVKPVEETPQTEENPAEKEDKSSSKKGKGRKYITIDDVVKVIEENEVRNLSHLNDKFYGAYAAMVSNGWKETILQMNIFTSAKKPKATDATPTEEERMEDIEKMRDEEKEVDVYNADEDEENEEVE